MFPIQLWDKIIMSPRWFRRTATPAVLHADTLNRHLYNSLTLHCTNQLIKYY